MEQRKPRKPLPIGSAAGGISYTLAVIFYLIINLIASGIISLAGLSGTDGGKYISYLVSPIAIGITLAIFLAFFKQPAKRLLPLKCHPKYFALGIILVFGLMFSLSWVNEWFVRLLELCGYTRLNNTVPDLSGAKIIPAILVIAVIPAIMEEIVFRGILLSNLQEEVGSVRTIFLVGFCFSLYHGSVEQTIYQFICGCLFAFLAIRSGSILPSITIHFINNALIIILTACGAVDATSGELILSLGGSIAMYVISGLCLIGAVVWLILDKTPLKKCTKGGVKKFFAYASVGIAAMGLIWILGIFL